MTFNNNTLPNYENKGNRLTSVSIPHELWLAAKKNMIPYTFATMFGIEFLLAEKGLCEYPRTHLQEEIDTLQKNIMRLQKIITDLNTPKEEPKTTIEDDFKEVFGE